ncbi:MAG TPA: AMP-binding protein [Egibacteraceae bacterium]|nr:AMP-binding protein [Egibacteraceae bacterium]
MPDATPLIAVRMAPLASTVEVLHRLWDDGAAVLPLPDEGAAASRLMAAARPTGVWTETGVVARTDGVGVADGTALVVATSGSTGAPRSVVLSRSAVEASARASLRRIEVADSDRWLCCLPLHHIAGLQVVVRSRLMGAAPVVLPRFDPVEIAARRDASLIALVPTMLRRLLAARVDLSHLRTVLLGGAPAPRWLLAEARAAGLTVVQTYGMTETSGGCVYDGVPLGGVEVRLDDAGRIHVRGPVLFDGYRFGDRRDVLAGGWLRTADLGRLTGGRLVVEGRADDVIITGGENVAADAVADLLERHPAVAEAAVVGRPDPEWGEVVIAVVVPHGTTPPSLPELRDFVGAAMGRHAAPRDLVVVTALPRLANGKLDRLATKALAAG